MELDLVCFISIDFLHQRIYQAFLKVFVFYRLVYMEAVLFVFTLLFQGSTGTNENRTGINIFYIVIYKHKQKNHFKAHNIVRIGLFESKPSPIERPFLGALQWYQFCF